MLFAVLFAQGCGHRPPTPRAESIDPGLPSGPPILHATDAPTAILDKAIAAFGGPAQLNRWKCGHIKYLTRSDTIPILDEKPSSAEEFFQLPGHLKRIARIGCADREQTIVFLIDSDQGWEFRPDGSRRQLPNDSVIAVMRTEHAFSDFCNLTRLNHSLVRLSVLGEQTVNGRAAIVLHAETDFTIPTDLAFDRSTGLLLQSIRHLIQPGGGDKTIETVLGNYRDVGGSPVPHRIVGRSDGKVLLDFTITDLEFVDHFDDGVFAAPDSAPKG
jgi:hypothetical protein